MAFAVFKKIVRTRPPDPCRPQARIFPGSLTSAQIYSSLLPLGTPPCGWAGPIPLWFGVVPAPFCGLLGVPPLVDSLIN